MPDPADERTAFREAMARAEAASGIERDAEGNEINGIEAIMRGETPVAIPELEGAVPVAASDQPLTPEPVTPATPAATDTPEQQQQVAPAAIPTLEELQAKLAVAEARLEEKDSFIGRQSGEVGELRQAVEEMRQQLQKPPVAPQAPESTIPVTQELIDTNPALAVQAAFAQGNEQALEYAFNAWKEEDPFTASTWLADKKLERQQQEFDAKLAATQKRIEETSAPLAEAAALSAEQAQWKEAFDTVKATHPDVFVADPESGTTTAERLITAAGTQPEYAAFKEMLQNGDASTKAAALSALYALEKVGNPAAFKAQLDEAATEAAAEAAAALAGAGVVNGQSTAGQPSEQKTTEELEAEAYVARQRSKPSLSKGWTGRG